MPRPKRQPTRSDKKPRRLRPKNDCVVMYPWEWSEMIDLHHKNSRGESTFTAIDVTDRGVELEVRETGRTHVVPWTSIAELVYE